MVLFLAQPSQQSLIQDLKEWFDKPLYAVEFIWVCPALQAVCGLWVRFLLDSLGNRKGWVGSRRLVLTPSVIPSYLENVSFYAKKVFLLIAYLELAKKDVSAATSY